MIKDTTHNTKNQRKMINVLRRHNRLATGKLAVMTAMNYYTAEITLCELEKQGLVSSDVTKSGVFWEIKA